MDDDVSGLHRGAARIVNDVEPSLRSTNPANVISANAEDRRSHPDHEEHAASG
jgi:hypothetical protein